MRTIELRAQLKAKNEKGRYDILSQHSIWDTEDIPAEVVEFQWKPGDGVYKPVWYLYKLPCERLALLCCFEDDVAATDERPHCLRRTIGVCDRTHLDVVTAIARGATPHMSYNDDDSTWSITCDVTEPDNSLWRTGFLGKGTQQHHFTLRINKPAESPKSVPLSPSTPPVAPKAKRSCLLPLLPWLILVPALGFGAWQYAEKQEKLAQIETLREQISELQQENSNTHELIRENKQLRKQLRNLSAIRKRVDELHELLAPEEKVKPTQDLK